MARVVRKVSNKNVHGQKKQKGIIDKKIWIIGAIILVLVIAGIIIGVVVANNNDNSSNDTVENKDHFGQVQIYNNNGTDVEITFEKITFGGLNLLDSLEDNNPLYVDYFFVYATNFDTFYAEELKDNDGEVIAKVNTDHVKVLENLTKLQFEINKFNEENERVAKLYILDLGEEVNTTFLNDPRFVDSQLEGGPVFTFVKGDDGFVTSFSGYKGGEYREEIQLYYTVDGSIWGEGISNAINYMKQGFVDVEEE